MAKKKTKPKKMKGEPISVPYALCRPGDTDCPRGRELPNVGIFVRKGFNYTTPSAQSPRTTQDRLDYGCVRKERKNAKGKKELKFTGRLGKKNVPGLPEGTPDTFCKAPSKPCGDRASCPVQLVWVKGQPTLRFCVNQGDPGYLVPVESPAQAQALAERACKDWPRPKKETTWPKDFFKKKAPFVVEDAEKAYPKRGRQKGAGPWEQPGLGSARRPSAFENTWPALLAFPALMILVLANAGKKVPDIVEAELRR